MHPVLAFCSVLVAVIALLVFRSHYVPEADEQESNRLDYPSGATYDHSSYANFSDAGFAPLLAGYRRAAREAPSTPAPCRFRSGHVPKVVAYICETFQTLYWHDQHLEDIMEGRCALPCNITTDLSEVQTADAVLIHLTSVRSPRKLKEELGARDPSQPWIMFDVESPFWANFMFSTDYKDLNGVFNRTMHYRWDADIRVMSGFVVRRGEEASLLPPAWRRPSATHQKPGTNRKLAVAFISNCEDDSGRLSYVTELREFAPVDVYGRCGDRKCGKASFIQHRYQVETDPCMTEAGHSYLFYLAFENCLCKDYVTEKLYNLLFFPIVPVVLGAADYSQLLPPHSYINARDYSPQQLAQRLLHLAQHPQEYQQYLAWRQYYQPSTVGGTQVLCDLCVRLHDQDLYQHKVVDDFHGWLVTESNCSVNGTLNGQN